MLTFSFDHSQTKSTARTRYGQKLTPYIQHLDGVMKHHSSQAPEASLLLPEDKKTIKHVQRLAQTFRLPSLRYVILVGIGGSNLGTKAIYDALGGYTDAIAPDYIPKLICLDTIDPIYITAVLQTIQKEHISSDQYVVNIISKSGSTAETAANVAYLAQIGSAMLPEFAKRLVVTTDHNSVLWNMATEKGYTTLEIPKQVGGRYSVFSTVGLFPLACLGVDIKQVCKGAAWAIKQGLSDNLEKNPSAQSAIALVDYYTGGGRIHDTFFFAQALETVGKWYRQLFAESLGKVPNGNTKRVSSINLTPTISIGSTDLHSMAQLYLANPGSRFTTFVSVRNTLKSVRLGNNEWTGLVSGLQGNTLSDLMKTIYQGVVNTYVSKKMPLVRIEMKECAAFSLGALMQMKMLEVMYCAHLLNVNAFDQPHVELYKKEVRKLLK